MALTKVDQTMVNDQVFGRRNIFINGKMQVAQRATSATSQTGTGYFTVDRWQMAINSAGTWDVSRSTTVPSGEGFAYSHKLDCTGADSSLSASDYMIFRQKIEGINLQHLKYGTSSAEKLTLSFWVRSAKTGTYIVEFFNNNSSENKTQSQSYTISSADTWEKKTIMIDGDTARSIQNTTSLDLLVYFWLAAGSTYTGGGSLNTSWSAVDTVGNNVRAKGQVNLADSTSNDWYITGIQLEVGDNATPFEHLSYGEELALCQRYYCVVAKMTTTDYNQLPIMNCSYYLSSQIFGVIHLPCQLRAAPSLEQATGTNYYRVFRSGASDYFNGFTGIEGHANPISFAIYAASNISGTEGVAGWVETFNNAAYIAFDAEL